MKKIILIVGLPGSGKSLASEIIKRKFKAEKFSSGDIIREEIKRRGWKYTPENDRKIADWFHTGDREKLLVKRTWSKIKNSRRKYIVIDGLRSVEGYVYLKNIAESKPIIISILAPFNVRVKREIARGRFGKTGIASYLRNRDKSEGKIGVNKLMRKADFRIYNPNISKKQFEKRVLDIVKKI